MNQEITDSDVDMLERVLASDTELKYFLDLYEEAGFLLRKGDTCLALMNARCATTKATSSSHADYCMNYVKRHDYENYLCTLLLPQGARDAVFAIRAFNIEVAQIQDLTSDPTIALMRFQFWRDSLDKIYKGAPPHSPIGFELAKVVQKFNLTKGWFTRIIDGRSEQLTDDNAYNDIKQVEERAEKTQSSILYLSLESLGVKNVHADHAASHIGKSLGIVTVIRAVPFHTRRNKVYLPTQLMIKHKVSQEEVLRGCKEQKMKDLVYELASEAHHHLEAAATFKKDVSKQAALAFLPTVIAQSYLKSIQRCDFDVFDSRLLQRNNWLPFTLWRQKMKGTF